MSMDVQSPLAPDPEGTLQERPCTPPPSTCVSSGPSSNFTPQKKSLGLLAEIACLTAAAEQKDDELLQQRSIEDETKPKVINYTLEEVRHWPANQLLSTFTESSRDPKRKLFTFKCHMMPGQCEARFDGPEETKTRGAMVEHLAAHLCNLQQAPSSTSTLTTTTAVVIEPAPPPLPPATAQQGAVSPLSLVPPTKSTTTTTTTISNSSSSQRSPSPGEVKMENKDEPMLDHVYTLPVKAEQAVVAIKSPVIVDVPMVEEKVVDVNQMIELVQSTTTSSTVGVGVGGESPLAPTIVSETVEVISDPSPVVPVKSQGNATDVQMQSLALHYIEDIRRKSSTAAKSVIINGDRSVIYQCKICPDKQFTSTNGLIFHYKKHAGLKPYVCELCSSTFTRQHSLNYHMLIHMNKSRFVCSECSRHFRHPSHFKEHMRRHTGETPFQCADCLIRFKTRNTYKRHLQTKHSKILTSKGIIELSPAAVPYQSVTRHPTGTATVSTGSMPVVASGTGTSSVKPRRKYAISYLHKNIETMSKYEEQQQQHHHHHHQQQQEQQPQQLMAVASTSGGHQDATLLGAQLGATAQTAPGSNITILSIPQLPTALHILNNAPSGPETANLARQALAEFNSQQQPITLVLPAGSLTTSATTTSSETISKMVEPISLEEQQLALSTQASHHHHLTELTSMAPAAVTLTSTASLVMPSQTTAPTVSNNDNFQRLLEAIALTEA